MSALTTGDPFDPATAYGPLSSEAAAAGLMAQVQDAVDKGATVRTGGRRAGRAGRLRRGDRAHRRHPGDAGVPRGAVRPGRRGLPVADVDEAVALANDTPFGLGGAVFHSDPAVALRRRRPARHRHGLDQRAPRAAAPSCPFGGTKRSGVGRELGPYGIDEFVNSKLIHAPAAG